MDFAALSFPLSLPCPDEVPEVFTLAPSLSPKFQLADLLLLFLLLTSALLPVCYWHPSGTADSGR